MSAVLSFTFLAASQIPFYAIGDYVLKSYILAKDSNENHSNSDISIKIVYFLSVCISFTLFELLGCEILGIMPKTLRWFMWELCLIALLCLLIFVLPHLLLKALVFGRSKSNFPKALIVILCIYLWLFYKMGHIFPLIDENIPTSRFSLQQGLGRIGIFGITLMAFISGYGSVSGPSAYLFVKKVTYEHVESAERNYQNSQRLLEEKREQYRRFCERKISEKPDNSTFGWLMKRVSHSINMNYDDQDSLAEEISNLELVVANMRSDYESVNYDHQLNLHSKTFHGKLFQIFNHCLSIYCVYRIFSAFINIIFNRIGRADPVTIGIGFFVHIFGIDWNVQLWSKEISFIFVGFIIISSIKNFLSEILNFFKIVDRKEYSRVLILFSAQLVGLYVTSTILMLRLNLPPENRLILTDILNAIKFDFFEKWFDAIYIVSTIASGFYIYSSKSSSSSSKY